MPEDSPKEIQMRKAQITINNPQDHDMSHDKIRSLLTGLKSCIYYIMCDEVGGKEKTYHTHIYVVFRSPVRFSTLKRRFPMAHIEKAMSTHANNRNYVKKEGKWLNTEKGATSLPNTLEEWGTCPPDTPSTDELMGELYTYIKDGLSNYEILEQNATYIKDLDKIDRVRLTLKTEEFKKVWRNVDVTYIYGKTGLGKSRYVMETFGYENVFRITDYVHPWDTYQGQETIVLEEFNSSFPIQKLLNYLDGYPLKLEARYSDKTACFLKIFLISNLSLEEQYPNIRDEQREVWLAFIRRIHKVIWYKDENTIIHYDSTSEYFHRDPVTGAPVLSLDF